MAKIKMRLNKDEDAICTCCKNGRDLSLDMYDVKIGNVCFTIWIRRRGRSKYEI